MNTFNRFRSYTDQVGERPKMATRNSNQKKIYFAMWRSLQRVIPLIFILFLGLSRQGIAQISVSLPSTQGVVNNSDTIPLTVGDLTGQGVTAFQFVVTYDPSVIEITGAAGAGTLSEGKLLLSNTTVSGQISVSGASDFDYEGGGVLVNLEVTYLSEGTSALTLSSFMFNEGSPSASSTNGSVTVTDGEGPSPVNMSLPNSSIGAVNESLTVPVSVDDVSGKNIQSYEFTFTYDAAALRVDGVNIANTLSAGTNPTTNSSVPGQFVVTWLSGSSLSGSGTLIELVTTPLSAGNTAINLTNVVFNSGDPTASVSGGTITVNEEGSDIVQVTLPSVSGETDEQLLIPLSVGDLTGKGASAFEMTIDYDPTIIRIDGIAQAGTLTNGTAPIINLATPGKAVISWASVSDLSGAGVLLNFEVTLLTPGVSPFSFDSFTFNEGLPQVSLTSGSVSVVDGGSGIRVSLPDELTGDRNTQILIPMSTESLTGQAVTSFVYTITYNRSVLEITGLNLAGTLTDGAPVSIDTSTPGQVVVTYSGATPLTGEGVLMNLVANLLAPGTTSLSITSFQFNNGTPVARTVNGRVTVNGQATYVQVVHNSSDASAFDVYINDEKRKGGLIYAEATEFLSVEASSAKIEIVPENAPDNSSPIASLTVVLENGRDYVAVINGLVSGSGKQAIGLVLKESQQEATNANSVGLVMFQGSPDAPPINAYIVDDSGQFNRLATLAKGLTFGDSFLTNEFEPGVYNIEVTQNNGPRIGIYRADLTRTGGASLLFMVQGFVNPLVGQPDLSMTVYAPDGQGLPLPITTPVSNEDEDELPNAFNVHGNYPNPFNPTTSIRFDLPEPASVRIEIFDIAGRNVMTIPSRQYLSGNEQIAHVDASGLSSGIYVYRLIAEGGSSTYVQSQKMTLLK